MRTLWSPVAISVRSGGKKGYQIIDLPEVFNTLHSMLYHFLYPSERLQRVSLAQV